MSRAPKVSAIVVSYNRSADLRLSLEALFASQYPDLEVIVVDNASSDDAADVAASFAGVKLVRNADNKGFAEANNQGLALATGDYIALVNNDAVVDPTWLEGLVAFLEEHPGTCAAGGKAYFWNDENPVGNKANAYYSYTTIDPRTGYSYATMNEPDDVREVATLSGCCVMIRRAAIDDVGGPFLEPLFFTYYEETDFFARAIRRGWTVHYVGSPPVWHRVRGGAQGSAYRYLYYMQRNRALFLARNASEQALRGFGLRFAWNALAQFARQPTRMIRGSDDEARAHRDAYRWLIANKRLVEEQRASVAHLGDDFEARVDTIQARASYYGHARPEVAKLVPKTAMRVIDVGCGAGGLGRALKAAQPGREVRGIEYVAEQAERARQVLDDVRTSGAESGLPAGWERPDCVIFADVLEHLVDPWTTLRTWRDALAPGGTLVVSLPNVLHRSVTFGALRGEWNYVEAGVLDRTHLRFFTRETAIAMLEGAGFAVDHVERVVDLHGESAVRKRAKRVIEEVCSSEASGVKTSRIPRTVADLSTVQFLLTAH
jgi:GT2 family glycosyltransferase/2-polyprenyl-3-methyl-5-hydroxy-6-metoxy-1,4-benzoquinol methylase